MTEDERKLWERYGQGDEVARRELILFYLPLVDLLAKRIARNTGVDWQDLRQEGIIGLIKALARFEPGRGVPFGGFAKPHICGAIFDSSEITRDMARRQDEIYRKIRKTEDELTQTLQRQPTIEEVGAKAQLTIEQIHNAIESRGIAFAGPIREFEGSPSWWTPEPPPESTLSLREALAHLSEREQAIVRLYYWEGLPHEEIAQVLGLTSSNVSKLRQRALGKLRKRLA